MKRRRLIYTLFFAVYLFSYLITISYVDVFFTTRYAIKLHYFASFFRTAGFFTFPLTRHIFSSERIRRDILIITGLLSIISAVLIALSLSDPLTVAAAFLLYFSLGHIGGLFFYIVSEFLSGSSFTGRLTGIACAFSTLGQLLYDKLSDDTGAVIIVILLFFIIVYLSVRPPSDFILENPLPYSGNQDSSSIIKKQIIIYIVLIAVMCFVITKTDISVYHLQFSGVVDTRSYPRLSLVMTYLIAGMLTDLCGKRSLNAVISGLIILSSMVIVTPLIDNYYIFYLCVYCIGAATYNFTVKYLFIAIAPRTRRPELWAGFGQAFSDIMELVFFVLISGLRDSLTRIQPLLPYIIYFTMLTFIVIISVVSVLNPDEIPADSSLAQHPPRSDSHNKESLDDYPLTPREREVANLLLNSDIPMKTIAMNLSISERSVYRYSNSIYQKTDTVNRAGLVRKFFV